MFGRRYRRSYRRPVRPIKYSAETFNDLSALTWRSLQPETGSYNYIGSFIPIVTASNVSGMRKVKNFTIEINPILTNGSNAYSIPFAWAIVYVPEGQNPSPEFGNNTGGGSLYEPNQNVIMSGTGVTSQQSYRKFNRLARNLNSGDRIYLLIRLINTAGITLSGDQDDGPTLTIGTNVSYAICYS